MKAVLTRSLGNQLIAALAKDNIKLPPLKDCREGAEVDLRDDAWQALSAQSLAVTPDVWEAHRKASAATEETIEKPVVKPEKK